MKKTKKALASLAIAGMVLTMVPFNAFATGTVSTRLAGDTAAQTAVAIADQTGWTGTAILASSATYGMVDALTSGPLAKFLNAPILLQEPGTVLNADTKAELIKLNVKKVYVTSGTAVINQAVLDQIVSMGIVVESLGGFDRFETSVNIAKKMVALGAPISKVAVAYGWLNQDALSIASIASAQTEPILLTEKDSIPASVKAFLTTNTSVKTTDVIGGTGVISEAVKAQLPDATRYYGNSAYDTNVAVLKAFDSVLDYNNVFIANGDTAIDALAGAPLAAKYNAGIVLTNGSANEGTTYVSSKLSATSVVTALGGTAVVPEVLRTGIVYTPPTNIPPVVTPPAGGGGSGHTGGSGYTAAVTSIAINPGGSFITIPDSGATTSAAFTAMVKDQNGNTMTSEAVTWILSSPKAGVTVNTTNGAITVQNSTTPGSITLKATSNSKASVSTTSAEISLIAFSPIVNLGTAGDYAILAKSGISSVPNSVITGDIGVSPAAATFITGFSLTADATKVFSTSTQITGKVYAPAYTSPTPSNLTTAVSDMETAYIDAAGRAADSTELGAGDISGLTLTRGVYKWGTGVLIESDVTLSGGANDVFIFQIAQGITQASGTKIILAGGVQAKNIFWQSAGAVDIGTTAHFEGNILGKTNIALKTGASINGRLLAQTAVTLDASTVVAPATVAAATVVPIITGAFTAGNTSVSGTAVAGASVVLSLNGVAQPAVTATGGSWTVSGLTLAGSDVISVTAILAPDTISAPATTTVAAAPTSETVTVSNPATTGFTVALNAPLVGLTPSNFTLLDSSSNPVTITSATTTDVGATYTISAVLTAGQTYTVTGTKTGYTFGTAQNVVVPGVIADTTSPEFTTEVGNNTVIITLTGGTFKAGEIVASDFTFAGTDNAVFSAAATTFTRISDTVVTVTELGALAGGTDNTILVKAATQATQASSVSGAASTI